MLTKPNLVGLLTLGLAPFVSGCSDRTDHSSVVQRQLLEAFRTADEVAVMVSLRDPAPESLFLDPEGHRWALRDVRESVTMASPGGFVPTREFEHVPAVAGRLSRVALDSLSHDPNVAFIQLDGRGYGALSVSVPAIGADVAQSTHSVTGRGVRVAVLDTGANTSHPDLESSILSTQRCFTRGACPPGNASEGTSAEDDHGHGSHVSGIVTSDGTIAGSGFAPDAEIVAVKINDYNDSGWVSDWVAGLDWVFTNLSTLNVKIINMSICTNQLYGSQAQCDAGEPALAAAVRNLVDAGVTLFAASGNVGSPDQLAAPACNSGVIAVGATYKSNQGRQPTNGTYSAQWGSTFASCADSSTAFDEVACFTNSGEHLDIVAPGAVIVSSVLGTRTEEYRGTSQASPAAAGVAAMMLECNPTLTPAEVKEILVGTGVSVVDPKNGMSYPSIRAAAAVEQACSASAGSGAGGANNTGGSSTGGTEATSGHGGEGESGRTGTLTGGSGGAGASAGSSNATGGVNASAGGNTGTGGTSASTGGSNAVGGTTATTGGTSAGTGGGTTSGGEVAGTGGQLATGGAVSDSTGGAARDGLLNTGGAASSSAGSSAGGSDGSGCGCRTAGALARSRTVAYAGWVALLGLAFARRRRGAAERKTPRAA